jgi:hypothetical protein
MEDAGNETASGATPWPGLLADSTKLRSLLLAYRLQSPVTRRDICQRRLTVVLRQWSKLRPVQLARQSQTGQDMSLP